MEWVETTGRTIEEAKEAALDELGVDEQDAEFEVLEEPKVGLFGRLRSEGRIRARVRPTTPRAKDDRRDRRRRPKAGGDAATAGPTTAGPGSTGPTGTSSGVATDDGAAPERRSRPSRARSGPGKIDTVAPISGELDGDAAPGGPRTNPSRRRGGRSAPRPAAAAPVDTQFGEAAAGRDVDSVVAETRASEKRTTPARSRNRKRSQLSTSSAEGGDDATDAVEGTLMDVALDEQGKVAEQFLLGLLDSFALPAQVVVTVPDDDTIDIQVTGADLGLLIGPKGSTLLSIQDLTRTVVQRKTSAGNGRIFIDVSGYRQKRNEALTRFAHKIASDVLSSQSRIAMEPMSAPDRKTVHDAITEIDGVDTISEGEDAQRHVVVVPAG
jgi:spoIIIJ-associated protein